MPKFTSLQSYLEKVAIPEPNSGCWLYLGAITRNGYPASLAHRRAFRLSGKALIKGLTLDHLCRVRSCINPDHLQQVTYHENLRRSPFYNGYKTHCPKGHSLFDCYVGKNGHRWCRRCADERQRQRRAANPEKYNFNQRQWRAAKKAKLYKLRKKKNV